MKSSYRIALCCALLLFIPLYFLETYLADLSNQYHAGAYFIDWLSGSNSEEKWIAYDGDIRDKVIVMAKLEEESVNWVHEELPDWQRAIYTVNPSKDTLANNLQLKTPLNKGHESMAYLTYLIDHYEHLPSTIAFIHSHRSGFLTAWHVDAPLHDNIAALRSLQLDFVQQKGYVNLRCNTNPGCSETQKHGHMHNPHVTEAVWTEIFEGTSTPPLNTTEETSAADERGSDPLRVQAESRALRIPTQVAAACCAQFAVSRDQVLQRPRDDYIKIRQWVIDTDRSDASSGRVMEYLWHVIFAARIKSSVTVRYTGNAEQVTLQVASTKVARSDPCRTPRRLLTAYLLHGAYVCLHFICCTKRS